MKQPRKARPNAPEKRCFLIDGRWHWKPDRRLRAAFKGVALGADYAAAMLEARRLNREAEAWLEQGGRAPAIRRKPPPQTVGALIAAYKASLEWKKLRPKTQEGYAYLLKRLEDDFGHDRARAIDAPRVKKWHGELAFRTPETARHLAAVARMLFGWAAAEEAFAEEMRAVGNPFKAITLGQGNKRATCLTLDDVKAIAGACDAAGRPSLGTALVIAFSCVQRISDVLRLKETHVADGSLCFTQSKSSHVGAKGVLEPGFQVDMALPGFVAARLNAHPPIATMDGSLIVCETTQRQWSDREAARAFRDVCDGLAAREPRRWRHLKAAQLRDGRRSGFVQYLLDGASVEFICSMSGHSIEEGYQILEHYIPKTRAQADRAVALFSAKW